MKQLRTEKEVGDLLGCRGKEAMLARIGIAHANTGGFAFDAVADCGGDFYLLEEGDEPQRVVMYYGGPEIDLTDLGRFEYVERSVAGVFVLFLATNDAGGPSFFVPDEPWAGEDFRRLLAVVASRQNGLRG